MLRHFITLILFACSVLLSAQSERSITVYLANEATEGTSVRLDVIGSSSFSRNANLGNGQSCISFDNVEYRNGIVLVTLMKNGIITDSKKITQ